MQIEPPVQIDQPMQMDQPLNEFHQPEPFFFLL